MSENGIAWLPTKEARQIAKLDLAAQKRGESYDIDLLPTKYDGNDIINNPNVGGLQPHRPWTAGSPPPSGNDFGFTGDQNMWIINGGFNAGSTFSDPAPTNPAYTYPDGSYTGKTYNFDGTTWMSSLNTKINGAWTTNAITVDFWFYPTANGIQLISESDHQDVTSGYHYSMLEIDSSGYVHARFYNGTYPTSAIVSSNTVELDKWNHIWFQETATGDHNFTLNNVAVTGNANYTRIPPTSAEYFLIGLADVTKITATSRFQGKIGYLNIYDYAHASSWNDQHNRFRPPVVTYPAPTNHSTGFATIVYDTENWGGNLSWFTGKTPFSTVYNEGNLAHGFGPGGYTGVFVGYFVPTVADTYNFYFTISEFNGAPVGNDARCRGWIGPGALLANSVPPNVIIDGAGVMQSGPKSLVVGDWYPIYIIAGFGSTGGTVSISVSGGGFNNESTWNDGTHGGHNTDTGGI